MIGQGPLGGFRVSPLSIPQIRSKAVSIRSILELPEGKINQEIFLESLSSYGITIDIVEDTDESIMPIHIEASCIPEEATIYLRKSTYEAVRNNEGRSLFTIFHELGHLLLVHRRTVNRETNRVIKHYEDSEWQANQFSAEMIMPLNVIEKLKLKTADQLVEVFGASKPAAYRRINQLNKRNEI